MKIVIATAVYYPMVNGVSVFSRNLAVGLVKRGHEVVVICPSQTGKSYVRKVDGVKVAYLRSVDAKIYPDQIHPVPKKKNILGLKLPHLWYKHGFRVSVFPALEVKKILDKYCPDVVHVQVSDPIGLSVVSYAKKHNIPVVTTEHNQPEVITEPLKMPELMKKSMNALLYSYFRNRQSKSDFVTMPTEQAIRNLLSKSKIDIPIASVSNGVDLTNFKPGKAALEIYEKYKITKNVPIVLYVGRLDPEKNVGLAIEAFKEARTKLPQMEMVIVGDGVDKARLEKLVDKLEVSSAVKFLGRILPPDLYEIYKIGSVFATASEIETQGIVLIEAAATGLPLIAVDGGAVAEICQTGKNGFLCPPQNEAELAKAIVKILSEEDLRKKFSQNSVKIAAEHDFEKTLDKFINIYKRVCGKNMV